MIGTHLVKQWFRNLEGQLLEQAEHAGLLGHSTLVGDAREFVVKQLLGSFLPRSLVIARGRVMGAQDEPSRQVDIVIFDANYPALYMPDGTGIFPIEGVIAAIEVKSQLDAASLIVSLDNCLSVMRVSASVWTPAGAPPLPSNGSELPYQVLRNLIPRTYIFGFRGLQDPKLVNSILQKWFEDNKRPGCGSIAHLPAIVVTEGAVAIGCNDGWGVKGGEICDDKGNVIDESKVCLLMWVLEAKQRFGWLASHLIYACESRYRMHQTFDLPHASFGAYLPFKDYYDEYGANEPKMMMAINSGSD